jgi:RNA-directed DNA polymerase
MARQIRKYSQLHLPQGAPTSPAIANLCAFRMDCRLTGLGAAVGASYTRYADDLVFSGDAKLARVAKQFVVHAAAIILEEGFSVHHRKTRIMRQGVRQRIAGTVVNQRLNLPREDFDRLKAILTNCARHGFETQNRDGHENFRSHLEGRVSYFEMVNLEKGKKLRELLNRICW